MVFVKFVQCPMLHLISSLQFGLKKFDSPYFPFGFLLPTLTHFYFAATVIFNMKKLNIFASKRSSREIPSPTTASTPSAPTDTLHRIVNAKEEVSQKHSVWKLLKKSYLNFWHLACSTKFCPIENDLSGNTVWPQASGFQKLAKMNHFWHF